MELPSKPVKEVEIKLPAITCRKTNYIPPINHPWRNFRINQAKKKNDRRKYPCGANLKT